MKLKILTETNYERVQELFNTFTEAVTIIKVDVFEMYNDVTDTGYITYHVFYQEKPWRD